MNGLLVRVGIDSEYGGWNAPMLLATGEFAYITIPEDIHKAARAGLDRHYDEFIPVVQRFGQQLPPGLLGERTHLDPDFDYLTYGDQNQRARQITSTLIEGDLL